jgi:hypothetical protein
MFAKLARFQGLGRQHAVPSAAMAAPCNDNRPVCRSVTASQLAPRRVLICGWRQVPATGRLECFWQVLPADSAAAEAPGMNWMTGWMRWSVGAYRAGKLPFQLAVVSVGLRSKPLSCNCHD